MLEPVTCRCCDQTIHPRDNAGTGDLPLCLTCLEDRYTACARCGTLIPNHQACYLPSGVDEDEPYCPDCYLTVAGQKPIHDYYYRPSPCFWGMVPFISAWSWRSTRSARTATPPAASWPSPTRASPSSTASTTVPWMTALNW